MRLADIRITTPSARVIVAVLGMTLVAATARAQLVCPQRANLVSPSEGATVSSPVRLDWSDAPNAIGYRVRIQAGNFSNEKITLESELKIALPAGDVSWTVSSLRDRCDEVTSVTGRFQVAATLCNPDRVPTLIEPMPGASTSTFVRFEWNAVPDAISYDVAITVNGGPVTMVGNTSATNLLVDVPPGAISWIVRAYLNGCTATVSQPRSFNASDAVCSGAAPSLLSPTNGAQNLASPVTLSWSSVSGADSYRVWASINGASPSVVALVRQGATTLTLQWPSGTVEWSVQALFDRCPPSSSTRSSFSIAPRSSCPTTVAIPLSPANGARDSTNPVTFSWAPAEGAFAYQLVASIDGRAAEELGLTKATELERTLPAGEIEWWVRALYAACPSVDGPHTRFTVSSDSCSGAPALLQPAENSMVVSPVEFRWTTVPGASRYRVWIEYRDKPVTLAGETPWRSLSRILPPGALRWWVEAVVERCGSIRSIDGHFQIQRGQSCTDQKPALLSPANEDTVVSSPVSLSWSEVTNAIAYQVWIALGDGGFEPVATVRSTSFEQPVPPGRIRWRVYALFEECDPVPSDIGVFSVTLDASCIRPHPQLLSPIDGDAVTPLARFAWTPVAGASSYEIWLSLEGEEPVKAASSTKPRIEIPLSAGQYRWLVVAKLDTCPPIRSAGSRFEVLASSDCTTPGTTVIRAPGEALSGRDYQVRWSAPGAGQSWELQESMTSSFEGAITTDLTADFTTFKHIVTQPTAYYYRARPVSDCSDERGTYSEPRRVVVIPAKAVGVTRGRLSASYGALEPIASTLFVPGSPAGPVSFTATSDQPWLTVAPSNGTIPVTGLDLQLTADPSRLNPGTSTASVTISSGTSSKGLRSLDTPTTIVPIAVSLVAPVSSGGSSAPPLDALIIPAIAHAAGAGGSQFVSDVRIANLSSQLQRHQLRFTATGVNGLQTSQSTTVEVPPGQTMALDDILKSWFGGGSATGESSVGALEIRPQTTTSGSSAASVTAAAAVTTYATSRTYNETESGTLGQFIPAVPYSRFVGKNATLSLQQISESSTYRTNIGLVEASGAPASIRVSVFTASGTKLGEFPVELRPREHIQLKQPLLTNGFVVDDGRIEVEVTSETGRITAYASVLDSITNDPFLVTPVEIAKVSSAKLVVPGVADLQNGIDSWRTDLRLFNGSTSQQQATIAFFPQGNSSPSNSTSITLAPGQVYGANDALRTLFNVNSAVGAFHITTAAPATMVATARTYNQTSNGTYGQFIPAVAQSDSIGLGDPTRQILQLEQSSAFRSNIGLVEVTGNPVTLEITAWVPGNAVAPVLKVALAANEFRQYNRLLDSLGVTPAYNARISIKVVEGAGRIAAYGSAIDEGTEDPTYVPAQ